MLKILQVLQTQEIIARHRPGTRAQKTVRPKPLRLPVILKGLRKTGRRALKALEERLLNCPRLVSSHSTCGADARRATLMLGTGACEGLFDSRLDVAFGLAADRSQFGNDEVTCALKHALLTK